MRQISVLCAFFAAVVLTSGCDFLRTVAGRPTSDVIEARAAEIARIEAEEQARAAAEKAAAEAAAKHAADSAAAVAYLSEVKATLIPVSSIRALDAVSVGTKYAIVVGSFSQPGNASSFAEKLRGLGYDAAVMKFTNSHEMVGVCPTDDIVEIAAKYPQVRAEKFCPPEAWILVKDL